MQNKKTYLKNLAIISVLIIAIFSSLQLRAQNTPTIMVSECSLYGTVYDYSGLDGCGYLIQLDDGQFINPVKMPVDIKLRDSMRVKLAYYPVKIATTCMNGIPAVITCIEEVPNDCFVDIMFTPLKCGDISLPVKCGPYLYQLSSICPVSTQKWVWSIKDSVFSKNPSVIYNFPGPGVYEICLLISATPNCIKSVCKKLVIEPIITKCNAEFEYRSYVQDDTMSSSLPPFPSYLYGFHDKSAGDPISWAWSFGDGSTSTTQNPNHRYIRPGIYEVCLTIKNATQCSSTICKKVTVGETPNCQAEFVYSPLVYFVDTPRVKPIITDAIMPGNPYSFSFMDRSIGNPIGWYWEFGDGTYGKEKELVHTFPAAGVYNVCLTIKTANGCSSRICKEVTVGVIADCKAYFQYYPLDIDSAAMLKKTAPDMYGYAIRFKDLSKGLPTLWKWSFGDGSTGNVQHPVHIYQKPGVYNVCLTIASKTGCSNTYCTTVKVGATADCKALFEHCVYNVTDLQAKSAKFVYIPQTYIIGFKNLSVPQTIKSAWDFGDGSTSNEKNPIHRYMSPGVYSVCLTIYSGNGCSDKYCAKVNVGIQTAEITYTTLVPNCKGYKVAYKFMANTAISAAPANYSWNFGDGEYSTSATPIHVFEKYGTYNVCVDIQWATGMKAWGCKTINVYQSKIDSLFMEKCGVSPNQNLLEEEKLAVMTVFPVPASEKLQILLTSEKERNVKIELINLLGGKTTLKNSYPLTTGANQIEIDLNSLSPGAYTWIISSPEVVLRGNITVIR